MRFVRSVFVIASALFVFNTKSTFPAVSSHQQQQQQAATTFFSSYHAAVTDLPATPNSYFGSSKSARRRHKATLQARASAAVFASAVEAEAYDDEKSLAVVLRLDELDVKIDQLTKTFNDFGVKFDFLCQNLNNSLHDLQRSSAADSNMLGYKRLGIKKQQLEEYREFCEGHCTYIGCIVDPVIVKGVSEDYYPQIKRSFYLAPSRPYRVKSFTERLHPLPSLTYSNDDEEDNVIVLHSDIHVQAKSAVSTSSQKYIGSYLNDSASCVYKYRFYISEDGNLDCLYEKLDASAASSIDTASLEVAAETKR